MGGRDDGLSHAAPERETDPVSAKPRRRRWHAADVRSDKAGSVLSAFETDLENCKSAWLWLCANPDPARFERLQDVVLLFDARARFSEGIQLFEAAIEALEPKMALAQSAGSSDETLLRGMAVMHINAAWLYTHINDSQTCLIHANQADKLLESLVETELNLKVLNILGTAADNLNKYDLALHYYQRSVTIAQKLHLRIREAMTRQNMGHVYSFLGQYEKAIAEFREAREVYVTLNEQRNLIYLNMSILHLMVFCIPFAEHETQRLLDESIEISLLNNELSAAQWFYVYSIFEHTHRNRLEKATEIKDFYQQNYPKIENRKDAFFRIALAKLATKNGQLEEAKQNLFKAIELVKDMPHSDTLHHALLTLAQVFVNQNDQTNAITTLRYLSKQPSLQHWLKKELSLTLSNCDDSIDFETPNQEPSQLVWLN